ncbi:MAG: LysM peptidoglycan-binding domain-containing protein [Deltaproteobacteria bacterium]|nr:LysM peptidoglycan-binding domain-containing protein [Deltaproteobacteria bacterium]
MKNAFLFAVFIIVCLPGFPAYADLVHTVQKGDTLEGIAEKYLPYTASYTRKELVTDIREMNDIESDIISIGQRLNIPVLWDTQLSPKSIGQEKTFPSKGVYVNKWSAGSRKILLIADRLNIYGANTIVFDAKDVMGGLSHKSEVPHSFSPAARYVAPIEDIHKMIEYLHRMKIHVVARVCVFRDLLMADSMHHWCIQPGWLNPADPEVQDYILSVIRELIHLGVDEIQLDYFRYPADGLTSTTDANKTRVDVIAGFLKTIHDLTSSSNVLLSLDIFAIVIWKQDDDILRVGQDINAMMPNLDIISPMLYPSHFNFDFAGVANPADRPYLFVSRGVQRLKEMVGDEVIIRPWLQAFPLRVKTGFDPAFIQTQIVAAQDSGAIGWLLWSPGNHYQDSYTAMEKLLMIER